MESSKLPYNHGLLPTIATGVRFISSSYPHRGIDLLILQVQKTQHLGQLKVCEKVLRSVDGAQIDCLC